MDIRTLYTLIAIADCGSFAEAGNRIGLSLSAVSMQVRALEEELEIAIFDRSRRPPVLTDAGLALVHRARPDRALGKHERGAEEGHRRGPAQAGQRAYLRLRRTAAGAAPSAEAGHGLEVHVTTGLTHDLERAVHHRQLDVAIVTEPEVPRSDLDFLPFVDEQLVVIAHRSVKGASDQEVLEQTPYVRFNRLARVGHLVQEEILRRQIVVRSTMEIDNLEGVVAMVANGWAPRWCRPGREERVPRHHPRDSLWLADGDPTAGHPGSQGEPEVSSFAPAARGAEVGLRRQPRKERAGSR